MTKVNNNDEFKKRWEMWCSCFEGDQNCICPQIISMVYDYAVWNLINRSRAYAEKDEKGNLQINGALHNAIDSWFFTTQLIAIRRLIDEKGIDGEFGVYSISGILKDMIKYSKFLTRKNIFKMRGIQYDYQSIKDECKKKSLTNSVLVGVQVPDELNGTPSEDLHKLIDLLSNTSPETRSREDTIQKEFLEKMIKKLIDTCSDIKKIVNKFIAHAATINSRNTFSVDKVRVTINSLKEAQKQFCKYSNFLMSFLTGTSYYKHLPDQPPNIFLHWDKPLIQHVEPEKTLRGIWSEYDTETQTWSNFTMDEIREMVKDVAQ